ncbi:PorV/PorQ family protein [candidate division KSB1 bacterium]|nr:PorV/PorQ family protein [candidate division KSB1 bacterium]
MKKINLLKWTVWLWLILMIAGPLALMAQQDQGPNRLGGPSRTGTAAAQFLQIGVSARGTGMGESFVALVEDASGAYYNPGVLSLISKRQALFNHTNLPAGLAHFYGSYVQPVGNIGTFALSFIVLTTGDIPVTVAFQGPTGETFSASDVAIGLSYARKLTDRFSVGGTAKFIAEDLAGFDARTVAFDVGTIYQTGFRHARLGMSVANFGPDIDFGTQSSIGFESQSFPLPITFRFGAAVDVLYGETNKLWLAAQLLQPNDNLRSESIGVEYGYRDLIFLRGGWKIDEENDGPDKDGFAETLSFGAGLNLSVSGFTGKFDFSWSQMSYIDDLVRFSILVGF